MEVNIQDDLNAINDQLNKVVEEFNNTTREKTGGDGTFPGLSH